MPFRKFNAQKFRIPLVCISLAIATLAAFWNIRHADFINYDDPIYITGNSHILSGITPANIRWAFTSGYASNWHPLTWISHMLDVQLFGLNSGWHHTINLLIHIANALLLFYAFYRMTKATWSSAFAAALFALHPLHVESVAWAAERKDVLSTFFLMLAIIAYCRYAERPTLKRYFPVFLFFLLGLMAKPMLVTFPLALLLLDYWPLQRFGGASAAGHKQQNTPARSLLLEKIPFFILSALSSAITYIVQKEGGAVDSFAAVPLYARISNAIVSYAVYIWKTLWPTRLAFIYPFPNLIPEWETAAAGLLLASITAAVFWAGGRFRHLAVGWLWYIVTLIPVIGLVQVGAQARADHYTYIPLIGLFIMAAWGVPELVKEWRYRKWALTAAAGLVLAGLFPVTWTQAGYWHDNFTLDNHALNVTNGNYIAYSCRGAAYAGLHNSRLAIKDFEKAAEANPGYANAYYNIGNIYAASGDYRRAINYYGKAIGADPGFVKAIYNLGNSYAALGDFRQAGANYTRALEIDPGFVKAYRQRALAEGKLGDNQKAYADLKMAARLGDEQAQTFLIKRGMNW